MEHIFSKIMPFNKENPESITYPKSSIYFLITLNIFNYKSTEMILIASCLTFDLRSYSTW